MKFNVSQIQNALVCDYGLIEGSRLAAVVFPNILEDFEKMLKAAPVGAIVREEYHFDDIRGTIKMEGTGNVITHVEVNKRVMDFGE